jgi:hypothetical protein
VTTHSRNQNAKAFVNLDDVVFTDIEDNGYYTSRRAQFSAAIGPRKLAYNLTELPPGKAQCPFHAIDGELPFSVKLQFTVAVSSFEIDLRRTRAALWPRPSK